LLKKIKKINFKKHFFLLLYIRYLFSKVDEKMSNKKKHAENCGCEHHDHSESPSHHMNGICPTDSFVDNLIDTLKKEFDKDIKKKQ